MLYIDKKGRRLEVMPEKVMTQVQKMLSNAGYDSLKDFAKDDAVVIIAQDFPEYSQDAIAVTHPDYKSVNPAIMHGAHFDIIRVPAGSDLRLEKSALSLSM